MKTIKFTILIILITAGTLSAQIKVTTDGKVYVYGYINGNNHAGEASMQVLGPNSDICRTGGRIAVGDYGSMSYLSANVFLGEYGNTDTDVMQLHGKKGFYFTKWSGEIIAYYDHTLGNNFKFYCDIYSNGIKLTSDERLKKNVKSIDNSLEKLRSLNGVSYNYNFKNNSSTATSMESLTKIKENSSLTEKERRDIDEYLKWKEEEEDREDLKMGFIAQDMQKIFPELVDEDKEGYLSIDYIGLIPVIVEALKEQQNVIDAQSMKIKELDAKITYLEKVDNKDIKINGTNSINNGSEFVNAFLYQNVPNPFSYDTEIKYFIPEGVNNAALYIFNLQGHLLMSESVLHSGEGSLVINATSLQPGIYIYSLLIDGKEVDMKRMILTE